MTRHYRHIAATLTALSLSVLGAGIAQAQTLDSTAQRALDLNLSASETGSNLLNFSPTLDGALLDLPDIRGASLLDFDVSDPACRGAGDLCFNTDRQSQTSLDYAKSFNAGGVIGLDVELEPRAAIRFSDEEDSALVGAIVRIGDDLKSSEVKQNTWYLFAGADAEAMHYSPNSLRRFTAGNFALQDRVIVGDAQAGIGYRMGDADVSLGYYRREVSSFEDNDPNNDFSISEDAAAISFTWRR